MQGRSPGLDLDLYLAGYPKGRLEKAEEQRIGALPFNHEDRWKLVYHNMRFAVKWCFNLYNKNKLVNDFEALLSVAQDAMINVALKRYRARGTPFVSYAAHYIRRDTNKEVHRQLCVVKLPDFREENQKHLREDARYQTTLDACEEHMLGTHDGGEGARENDELREFLMQEIERLIPSQIEKDIVIMYYGLSGEKPKSSTEIMNTLGKYSREGIRKALLRSKKHLSKSRVLRELVKN